MGSISVLHERIRFIEYSDIYIIDEVGFISRIPKLMTRDWIVIEPFTWTVWFMIIISFLIISIILYIISNHIFRASGENLPFRLIWSKLFAIVVNQRKFFLKLFRLFVEFIRRNKENSKILYHNRSSCFTYTNE